MLPMNYLSKITDETMYSNHSMPSLVYATKQEFGGKKRDRPMHSHENLCEILLVFRGFGVYMINNQKYSIQEGDVLFYNQNDVHEVQSLVKEEIGTYCFGLAGVNLKGLPPNHLHADGEPPVRTSGGQFDFMLKLCDQVYSLLDGDLLAKATAQALVMSFLLLSLKLEAAPVTAQKTERDVHVAESILRYLDTHYTEPVTLKSIAAYFRCSEPYISHVFKKATGQAPIQYVIRRRIGLAQTYLIESDLTATQIATLVGYDNTNYFITLFTRIIGVSPIRYRKLYYEGLRGNAKLNDFQY